MEIEFSKGIESLKKSQTKIKLKNIKVRKSNKKSSEESFPNRLDQVEVRISGIKHKVEKNELFKEYVKSNNNKE